MVACGGSSLREASATTRARSGICCNANGVQAVWNCRDRVRGRLERNQALAAGYASGIVRRCASMAFTT